MILITNNFTRICRYLDDIPEIDKHLILKGRSRLGAEQVRQAAKGSDAGTGEVIKVVIVIIVIIVNIIVLIVIIDNIVNIIIIVNIIFIIIVINIMMLQPGGAK